MKQVIEGYVNENGENIPARSIDRVCKACGYDLTEQELEQATCADCGAELEVKQSVSIEVTSVFSSGTVTL
jgi:hypothetical protein